MKKVFLSLATIAFVAAGSLTVTSCGGDDSVTPVKPVEKSLKLTVETAPADIIAGERFELSIKTADGTPITGAELQIDGENLNIQSDENGIFGLQGPAGEVAFTAEYDGVVSNEVIVVVNPAEVVPSEGTGSFEFGGVTYESSESYVVFAGLGYLDANETQVGAYWITATISGAYEADVVFYTPATPSGTAPNGQTTYSYELPTATNTTGVSASVYQDGTQAAIGTTKDGVVMTFNATPNESGKAYMGKYSAISADINGSPFSVTFDGTSPYINGAAKSGAKGATTSFTSALKANTGKISFSNAKNVRFTK